MTYSTNFSLEDLSFDNYGLIPAIAQDWLDGSILMLAWMNKESLTMTLETKNVHYWSRSRSEIWRKGATSGSTQILKEIRFDCDNDALILLIEQNGSGACHTGEKSCFFRNAFLFNMSVRRLVKNVFLFDFMGVFLVILRTIDSRYYRRLNRTGRFIFYKQFS